MIKNLADKPIPAKIEINLQGPDGNAYALLALAKSLAKQLELGDEQWNWIYSGMTSGDYENLLQVLDEWFGEYITLYR